MTQQPLAYLYPEFLESDEGRPIRILAEYLEPLRRFKETEDPGHRRLLRIGARGQPRARRAGAPDAARARRAGRGRALRARTEPRAARPSSGRATTRKRASSRGCSTTWSQTPAVGEPSLRRHVRRRPGHHGSGQPRRARGGRQDHRSEHPPAVRAGRESVHHRRAALRVPLLLHAQVLVRVPREGAGRFFPAASARSTSCSRFSRWCRPTSCRRRSASCSTAASTGTRCST